MIKIISTLLLAGVACAASATDDYTKELYGLYCKACHGVQGSGAPQAFTDKDWKPYLKLGMDKLVNNAINGIRNMPAMGTCSECDAQDLQDIIEYMSQQEQ